MRLYSTCVVRKKKGWPKYTHCDEVLSKIYGKDIIFSIIERKGNAVYVDYTFFLVARADEKYTSILLSDCASTQRDSKVQKRQVDREIDKFKCGEYQHCYYNARHKLDRNNSRQGCLSHEERFCSRD